MMAQLDLWERELSRLPWRGRSPRSLTRAAKRFILKPEAQKHERFFMDPFQYDLFPAVTTRRPLYGGAPSLLPLPGE